MKKALIIAFFLALVVGGAFRATHHPVYGSCHKTQDQTIICKLIKWEGNK